eukprot:CAMPEP_0173430432 /NCGR_PEP_ID=MMETSP1357-20121228/8854_1 /TAXON_ID=77926 /ORGANISM="Hemiselmis rufescens, Strain PCC563" /LENGTH=357 /DNA_ID=CAMNT_0014394761 /DNA_START=167 /DNA_END=1236 /DNA_ORIENTATION=+
MSNVRADGIVSKERAPDCYLKVNFDEFKTFKTETIKDSLTPSWNKTFGQDGLCFRYTTSGGGLSWRDNATADQVQSLCSWMVKKHLTIQIWNANMFSDEYIGECRVDLLTLCTGPSDYTLNFNNAEGRVTGHLYLSLTMVQIAEVSIEASSLRLSSLPEDGHPGPFSLVLTSNLDRRYAESKTNPSAEAWCPASFHDDVLVRFDSSLRDLSESTLNIAVYSALGDKKPDKIATSQVPLAPKILECHAAGGHAFVDFTAQVNSRTPGNTSKGSISGRMKIHNLPVFTPLYMSEGGFVVDSVVGGQSLYPFVPLPPILQAKGKKARDLNPKYGAGGHGAAAAAPQDHHHHHHHHQHAPP